MTIQPYLHLKNIHSAARHDEREMTSDVPVLGTLEAVWAFLRRYVPYTGDPGVPWLMNETTGLLDYYTHPQRTLYWANKNRAAVESGYQHVWPHHVHIDCDDIALLAVFLVNRLSGYKAEVLTLVGTPLKMSHVIASIEDRAGNISSIDTNGLLRHADDDAMVRYFERIYAASYTVHATPLPFKMRYPS